MLRPSSMGFSSTARGGCVFPAEAGMNTPVMTIRSKRPLHSKLENCVALYITIPQRGRNKIALGLSHL
jgi:hypothetical protein